MRLSEAVVVMDRLRMTNGSLCECIETQRQTDRRTKPQAVPFILPSFGRCRSLGGPLAQRRERLRYHAIEYETGHSGNSNLVRATKTPAVCREIRRR